jgi:hypothetical protein
MKEKEQEGQEVESKIEKGKLYLQCTLTSKEIYEAGKNLSDALKRVRELESRLDSVKQQIKGEMTTAEGDVAKYSSLVSSEREHRLVDVEIRFDFKANRKETVRMDTGEIVKTDTISDEERQKVMVFMAPKPSEPPTEK